MKKYFNEDLKKIVLSIFVGIVGLLINNNTLKFLFLGISYGIISYEMYIKAFHNIKKKEFFDENVLMILATLGAIYLENYLEALLVMILYQIGEYLSHLAVHRSKESITRLMDLRVEKICIEKDGKQKEVPVETLKVGDTFLVRPGEKIGLDGIVLEGNSSVDTSSITGESLPREVEAKDEVLSGFVNGNKTLKIEATSTYKTSTAQRILDLIENSKDTKTKTETFIHRFAKIYTPIVVLLAVLITIIPTLFGGNFQEWLYRALVFLVTSCPCALVISVPLGYFCGIGVSSKEGIVLKGTQVLEDLCEVDYLLLDKTGTITEGKLEVETIHTNMEKEEFLKMIASIESNSIHPIAQAIKNYYQGPLEKVKDCKEIPGKGLSARIGDKKVLVGNQKLMKENNIEIKEKKGTILYLCIGKELKGYIELSDKIKENNKDIKSLYSYVKDIVIISGDQEDITKKVANTLGISYKASLLPEDKVKILEEYKQKGKVMFVGDGINDAPSLYLANIGVSMGKLGSDAALEASDIVLMREEIPILEKAMKIARLTSRKVKESIILALAVKLFVLGLSIIGKGNILLAVIADVGVTLLVIFNVLTIFFQKIK